jgi:hypothetical protein
LKRHGFSSGSRFRDTAVLKGHGFSRAVEAAKGAAALAAEGMHVVEK